MKQHIIPSIRLTLVCLLFFCGIYTLAILLKKLISGNTQDPFPGPSGTERVNVPGLNIAFDAMK